MTDDPKDTEQWSPVPPVVVPAATDDAAPSDAIVLFDGAHLDEWVQASDGAPARWPVADGVVTVDPAAGSIRTKRAFRSYQLHLRWRVPKDVVGDGQQRGNSGLFLAHTGPGDTGYEIQILDSYDNPTYVNGQAAAVYKQRPPLVNAMRPPGAWQTYDVVWTAPTFAADGALRSPAYVTLLHNGVLVQHHVELRGETRYVGAPSYRPHGPAPILLQAHGAAISFRDVWVRALA